jgi:hypothetical protein
MTREEAKQLLPVIQAYAEGKEVQYYYKNGETWCGIEEPSFNPDCEWRVKPVQTYRAFESQEECWAEMQKHQPFGWLKHKRDGGLFFLDMIKESNVAHGNSGIPFEEPFEWATFADGTPFGIKVEED